MLVRTIANPAHSAPTNFVVRRLDADWLDCGRLFVDRRPVQRPGHQLLDQCRVKVQAVVPGSIVTSSLRLRGIKVVPWLSVYASHKDRISSCPSVWIDGLVADYAVVADLDPQ